MPAEWQAFLDSLIKTATANLGGVYGTIAKYLLEYGGHALYNYGTRVYNHMKRAASQKDAGALLKKVMTDPTATDEQKRKAKDDWINS